MEMTRRGCLAFLFLVRVFKNAGHDIQVIPGEPQKMTPGGADVAQPPTSAPGYWELAVDWLKKRTGASAAAAVRRAG